VRCFSFDNSSYVFNMLNTNLAPSRVASHNPSTAVRALEHHRMPAAASQFDGGGLLP
jgi:hypothetical protein